MVERTNHGNAANDRFIPVDVLHEEGELYCVECGVIGRLRGIGVSSPVQIWGCRLHVNECTALGQRCTGIHTVDQYTISICCKSWCYVLPYDGWDRESVYQDDLCDVEAGIRETRGRDQGEHVPFSLS